MKYQCPICKEEKNDDSSGYRLHQWCNYRGEGEDRYVCDSCHEVLSALWDKIRKEHDSYTTVEKFVGIAAQLVEFNGVL